MRQDTTDIGSGLTIAQNVSYAVNGELRRRPGLGERFALSTNQMSYFSDDVGSYIIGHSGTTLKSINLDTAAVTTLKSGLDVGRGSFASANGAMYYANGIQAVQVMYDGTSASYNAGIVAPASAPSATATTGTCTIGSHLIRYRWKNSDTSYYSNPSPSLRWDTTPRTFDTGTVSVTNASTSVTFSSSVPSWATSATISINGVDAGTINASGTSGTLGTAYTGATGTYVFVLTEVPSANQGIALTLASTSDGKVDEMVIEMTEVGGSTFYVVDTVSDATSYTISIEDDILSQGELADVYSAPDGYGHEPPPATAYVLLEHRNRIFYLTRDGVMGWSRASYPEAFNALEWSQKIFGSGGDKAVALGSFFGDLYVFGNRSMARFVYTGDPAAGMIVQMPTKFGVWNQNCVVDVEGTLWGWGRHGVFRVSEIQPRYMSAPIADTLNTDVDISYAADHFGFFDPRERVIWFVYHSVDDGASTGCRNAVVYDLQTGSWSLRSFRHKLKHAIIGGDDTIEDAVYVSDSDGGYIWRLTDGVFDGVPSTMTSGTVSVGPGATTTVIPTTTAMDSVVGAIVYVPSSGEEVRVSSNSTYSLSVTPALSTAPAEGEELYIGSIPIIIKSQWDPMEYAFVGRRPSNMEILHLSDTPGVEFGVRYYTDYSTTPTTWTRTADDAELNGLSIVSGRDYATQDVSRGKNNVPVPSSWDLVMQWELRQFKPTGAMRLLNCSFVYDDQRTAKDIAS